MREAFMWGLAVGFRIVGVLTPFVAMVLALRLAVWLAGLIAELVDEAKPARYWHARWEKERKRD